jgi:hypothetical protein
MPRKEFESFTRLDASDVNTYLMDQSVMSFAGTATRGSAIGTAVEGMTTYLEDSNYLSIYDGATWIPALPVGAWQSYTPTLTNITVGNGTFTSAKYAQIGKTIHLQVIFTFGSTSAVTGNPVVSLPVTAKSDFTGQQANVGSCSLNAGGVFNVGNVQLLTTTTCRMYATNAAGTYLALANLSSTVPGTWTTGNYFGFSFTYEAA